MAGARPSAAAIERLLRPRSVAVVGASPTPGALGASVIANLERSGYSGALHLINPRRDEIGGRPCLKSVEELPLGVDVAVLAIPRVAVLETIGALAARQVGAAIIFSSGFAEGGAAGLAEQREIARLAAESRMVIEGPNCLGLVNYVDGIALTFVEIPAVALGDRPGIGIISQSGALAAVVGVTLMSRELGISYSISTGNEAASGAEDYVAYLLEDARTAVIGLIVEQFREPRRFLELARRARELRKSIVLLHPGRSSAARQSAATHTGALAGDYAVMRAHVERQGVIVAETLEEFGDILELVSRCRVRPAPGSVVLTESGAFKALTLDLCEQIGLALPALTDATAPLLRAALPEFAPASNPIDLTAQALVDPGLYRRTLAALLQDERFGTIIFGIIQTDPKTAALKFPPIIAAISDLEPQKCLIFAGLDEGAVVPTQYVRELRRLQVPYFPSPERAYRALARLLASTERQIELSPAPLPRRVMDLPALGVVPEYRSKALLAAAGIAFPAGRLVTTLDEAQAAAAALGFPVVLKAQSADLPHKSDAGGVVLGLGDASSLAQGWARLQANITRSRPELALDGVLIEAMGQRGVELIIGGRNDPDWGPIVLAGFGGVQAEILQDVRLLVPDLPVEAIVDELYQLKSGRLLRGFRGSPELDVAAVAQIIRRVGALLRAEPSIQEIDLNPVALYPVGQGAVALDALIVMRTARQAGAAAAVPLHCPAATDLP
ncbi:MAG TPA: acetate--CoA ligase family protein [Steroidobacteraceae bacterium]|nr:acetate--CoA ligase family protein [Steroidobacteraceae bacterium]